MKRGVRMLMLLAYALSVFTLRARTEPQRTPPPATPRISVLIAQLGSSRFNEREAATRELGKIGLPALAALRQASGSPDAEVRRRARKLVGIIENSLETLAADYRQYGLPLPAKAPLVLLKAPATETEQPLFPTLAFLPERSSLLLQGTRYFYPSEEDVKIIALDPSHATPQQLQKNARSCHFQLPECGIMLAVQCKQRGWDLFARALFAQVVRERKRAEQLSLARGLSLRALLGRAAWNYWRLQLPAAESRWVAILPRLRAILDNNRELDTPGNRALVKSLAAALVPSKAKPGSIEALIDDLVHVRSTSRDPTGVIDIRYLRVADRGFDAVPALLDHLDDNRLTHHLEIWTQCDIDDFSLRDENLHHYRVGEVVRLLLADLCGEDGDQRLTRATVRRWWNRARKIGEEPYLSAHVFSKDGKSINVHILRMLTRKYPRSLERAYRTLLDRHPNLESEPVAAAVANSTLPRRKKIELLVHAAKNTNLWHRYSALEQLARLEPERFQRLLRETLDQLPATTKGEYNFCPEARLACLVPETKDKRVWEALERAARRADAGLRLEMLQCLCSYEAKPQVKQLLAFLAAFLDDATVRDRKATPDKYQGLCARDFSERLEIRNFAAMNLATLLNMKADPRPTWTPAQWAELRQQVRQALRERKGER